MTTSDADDFFPDPFPTAPEEPGGLKEYADTHDFDSMKKRILEATAADQTAICAFRRQKFLRQLDTWERIWFGQ